MILDRPPDALAPTSGCDDDDDNDDDDDDDDNDGNEGDGSGGASGSDNEDNDGERPEHPLLVPVHPRFLGEWTISSMWFVTASRASL